MASLTGVETSALFQELQADPGSVHASLIPREKDIALELVSQSDFTPLVFLFLLHHVATEFLIDSI